MIINYSLFTCPRETGANDYSLLLRGSDDFQDYYCYCLWY
jgi:hypothetical protein